MKHQIFSTALVEEAARKMKVANLQEATIGEVLLVCLTPRKEIEFLLSAWIKARRAYPANRIGIEAEKSCSRPRVGATCRLPAYKN